MVLTPHPSGRFIAFIILVGVILTGCTGYTMELQGTLAANYTKFEDSEVDSFGVSARFLASNFGSKKYSWFVGGNLSAANLTVGDYIAGYAVKSTGNVFVGGGIGGRYSRLWGYGVAVYAEIGMKLGSDWFANLPLIYRSGFSTEFTPYIGYRF